MGLLRLKVNGEYVTVAQGPAGPIGPPGDMVASPATLTANVPTEIPLKLKGASGQTGNLLEFLSNTGSVLAHIKSGGTIETTTSVNAATVRAGVDTGVDSSLHVTNADPARRGITVKGAASQTGNLAEFRDSAGTVLAAVDKDGKGTGGLTSAMVKLFDSTLSVATSQIDITSLSATTYPTMKLFISSPNSVASQPRIRFNGITTSTYQYGYMYTGYAGTSTSGQIGIGLDPTGYATPISADITIDAARGRLFSMLMNNYGSSVISFGEEQTRPVVTSISIFRDSSVTWPVGTRFLLYGLKV